jgi:chitodextrinase
VQFNVPANGFNWSQARGITMANGQLYWVTADGNLHSATFTGGAPQAGTDVVVNGPALGGQPWPTTNGMFLLSLPTAGDTEDPDPPGNLHLTGVSSAQVDLAWEPSSDNVGVIAYDIYRGGSLLASVPDPQTSFSDQDVVQGTFYSYQVFARDAAGNVSEGSNVVNVTTPTPSSAFSDGFESGNMSNWNQAVNTSVQSAVVFAGSNAAMATAAGTRAFASETLASTYQSLQYQTAFRVVSQGANQANLVSLQTNGGTGILAAFRGTNGNLNLRNPVTGTNITSNVNVSAGAWHQLEIGVNVNGATSTVQVLLDGVQVNALTQTMNLGTTPIGRLLIGDTNNGRTFQIAFDEVSATSVGGDTQDPSAPSNLQATSVTTDQVDLSWTGSTDNVGVTSYEIRRDGAVIDSVAGTETTYSDTTVDPGTLYAYQVFAFDAAGNESDGSNVLNVSTGSLAFSDGFESGNMSNWTQVVNTTVQSADVFAGSNAAMATSGGTRAFASRTLSQTFTSLSVDSRVKVVSQGGNPVNLLGLQSQTGTGIIALFRSTGGSLALRNVVTGAVSTGPNLPLGTWHRLQVVIEIDGATSTIQVLLNGSQVNALTQTTNLGTTPIGRLVIGDSNTGRTFQVGFDEVVAI